jgi:radical SAM superfamily enzyme YgiQ (UPF0313 family)
LLSRKLTLGPLYLGTIAKQAGYDVEIINENVLRRDITDQELLSADILCLSCITATINKGKIISRRYRDLRAAYRLKSRIIAGGIHASMLPQDIAPHVDQVVVGEAEPMIEDILSDAKTDPIIHGEPLRDLDSLPEPDFSLLKEWKTDSFTPIMTSRGCPYDCNFCSVTEMFGRGYRMQSPERVMQEVVRVKNGMIFFADDHFAANISRTDRLLDLMIKSNVRRRWNAQVRTDITKKPELIEKMRKAGCKTVFVGFESINPESLETMHKNQSLEDIKRSIRIFKQHGINVHGMFMLGNDPDTKETFHATARFLKESGIDYAQYTILTPLPGTDLYAQLEKEGRLLHKDWTQYDAMHVVFKPKNMTPQELQLAWIECFGDFYSYTNGINDALNAVVDTSVSLVKSLYKQVHFPRVYPMLMKFIGKRILSAWVNQNQAYIKYLEGLPT